MSSPSSPSSPRRIRASQANGAQSRGPVTSEGKAASARNALCHGLCAKGINSATVVLANEDSATFEQFHEALLAQYGPQTATCAAEVEELAVALWRVRRAWTVGSALFDREMDKMAPVLDEQIADVDRTTRLGLAFQSLSDNSRSLQNLVRYEANLTRQAGRLRKQLSKRKKYRTNPIPKSDTAATAAGDAWAHFLADVARTLTRYPEAHAEVLAIFNKYGVKTGVKTE